MRYEKNLGYGFELSKTHRVTVEQRKASVLDGTDWDGSVGRWSQHRESYHRKLHDFRRKKPEEFVKQISELSASNS